MRSRFRAGGLRRWLATGVICLLAVVMLGAGGPDSSGRFGRIGHEMMCVCGCGQILLECNHVGCPDSSRMIDELQQQLAGANGTGADSLVLNWFVAKYGATVLAAPIRGGFDTVAWIVPIALLLCALIGTVLLVRTWAARRPATVGSPAGGVSTPDSVRERIRRETEYL